MSFSIIPIRELDDRMRQPRTILIDLRDEEDYQRDHIPGAENIPYEQWKLEMDSGKYQSDMTIIFYCDRGNQSMYAAREMNRRGYFAISIAGGYRSYEVWKEADRKGTKRF